MMKKGGFTRELLSALLRKPDYAPPKQTSTWRVMSAEGLERDTSHALCDDACDCAAPSRMKYQPRND